MATNNTVKQESKIKRIASYVISILCLVLCIFITVEVIAANTQGRPPRVFGVSVSYVPTESMEPTIKAGEYVMYTKTSFNDVNVDDIIVYKNSNDMFIIHRVIEKNSDYLIAKGDNNPVEDTENVTSDMVYGKYVMTIGILSIFSGGISKNLIFFILIIIFVIMIGMQIVSIVIKNKTDEVNKNIEEKKQVLIEQLKKEILEEELAKLKAELAKKNNEEKPSE